MVRRQHPSERSGATALIAAWLLFIAGVAGYWAAAPRVDLVGLQLAATASAAREIVGDEVDDYSRAIAVEWWLIAAYGLALLLANHVGRSVFVADRCRRFATVGVGATLLAVTADVCENMLLLRGLVRLWTDPTDAVFALARVAAVVKFLTLAIAAIGALAVTVHACVRLRQPLAGPP